eukprot:2163753-Amphidinium_carterae.1
MIIIWESRRTQVLVTCFRADIASEELRPLLSLSTPISHHDGCAICAMIQTKIKLMGFAAFMVPCYETM